MFPNQKLLFSANTEEEITRFLSMVLPLEQVDSYTYLGVDFHRTGNLEYASLSLSKKGMEATKFTAQDTAYKKLAPSMFIKLFDQTTVPILTHASEIWGTFSLQSKTVFDDFWEPYSRETVSEN